MPTSHHENDSFEDRLGAALRQAGDTFDTDRPALIAAGQARGHRLRLRRTTPTSSSSAPAPVSGEDMIATLRKLLPEGTVSGEAGSGTDEEIAAPYARVVYDDGKGGGAVSVALSRVEPGSQSARDATTCPDKAHVPYDSCTTSRLSDGSVLMLFRATSFRTGAWTPSAGRPSWSPPRGSRSV
ncbi:hypothetical protein [Streptomyces sp. HC307]|uniref:hypothetical protein n=1 Tax=Streptomyces flavusporus TaxID=3385496 RepID=UPI0039174158